MELRRSLSADGRAWVNEVWQAAANVSTELSLLGPLTTALGMSFAGSYAAAAQMDGEEAPRALFAVIKAGYASRTVLLSPTDQPSLDASSFRIDAAAAVDQIASEAAAAARLSGLVRSIAASNFESVMTLPHQVWAAYVASATMQLQRELGTSTLTWRELDRDTIEEMLRYGYVLRCLDEALDGSPKPGDDDG